MDTPEPILPDLNRALQRAGARLYGQSGVEKKSRSRSRRRMTVAAACAAATAAATIAFVLGAGSDPHATGVTGPTDHGGFAVFDLPAAPHSAETLPVPPGAPRVTRDNAHRLSIDGHDVWVTSRPDNSCVILLTGPHNPGASALACGARTDAIANGLFVTSRGAPDAPGARWLLAGLIPDGVGQVRLNLDGGATKLLHPVDNVVVAEINETPVLARFNGADGREHVQKLGTL